MFTASSAAASASSQQVASATNEETKTPAANDNSQINLQYDWYQNVTHVFIGYKIKQGGEALVNGVL